MHAHESDGSVVDDDMGSGPVVSQGDGCWCSGVACARIGQVCHLQHWSGDVAVESELVVRAKVTVAGAVASPRVHKSGGRVVYEAAVVVVFGMEPGPVGGAKVTVAGAVASRAHKSGGCRP